MQLHDNGNPSRQPSCNATPIVMPPTFSGGVSLAGSGHMPVPSAYQDSKPVGPLHSKSSSRKLINRDRDASKAAITFLRAVTPGAIDSTGKVYEIQTLPAKLVCSAGIGGFGGGALGIRRAAHVWNTLPARLPCLPVLCQQQMSTADCVLYKSTADNSRQLYAHLSDLVNIFASTFSRLIVSNCTVTTFDTNSMTRVVC